MALKARAGSIRFHWRATEVVLMERAAVAATAVVAVVEVAAAVGAVAARPAVAHDFRVLE
jgi:hypothetical protein